MQDTYVTVIGNVVAEPTLKRTGAGTPVLTLRVASTPRRFDRSTGEWRDRETTFISASCWRALAEHVHRSVRKGDPVVVYGTLVQDTWETGSGERRSSLQIEAVTVGHDLSRGQTHFRRPDRATQGPGVEGPVPSPRTSGDPGPDGGLPSGPCVDGDRDTDDEMDLMDPESGGDAWSLAGEAPQLDRDKEAALSAV